MNSLASLGITLLLISGASSAQPANPGSPAAVPAAPAAESTPATSDFATAEDARPLPHLKPPAVKATSAILIDAVSGQVLYEKNADARRPMASTTKIMTALLFCEHVPESAYITASKAACSVHESSLHLKVGERLSAPDLLRAILMRSANDACVAAAEYVAGSESAFVDLMNARAAELGCTHTHFTNPHGLHSPDHYTSARDLATIARVAMQEPRIRAVVSTETCRITRSIDHQDVHLRNHSHFLGHFPGADGVKTGWTVPAGHCYVGSATWGGWRLLTVVLHSPDYVHETASMMKFGFAHYDRHVVAAEGEGIGRCVVRDGTIPTVAVSAQHPVDVVTQKGATPQIERRITMSPVTAPVQPGAVVGTVEAYLDDKPVCGSPLIAIDADPVEPINSSHRSAPWKQLAFASGILATGLVSLRYGTRFTAYTKGARRRRRRFSQGLRGHDRRRPRNG